MFKGVTVRFAFRLNRLLRPGTDFGFEWWELICFLGRSSLLFLLLLASAVGAGVRFLRPSPSILLRRFALSSRSSFDHGLVKVRWISPSSSRIIAP